jgi:hypothetical protein
MRVGIRSRSALPGISEAWGIMGMERLLGWKLSRLEVQRVCVVEQQFLELIILYPDLTLYF